MSPDKLAGLDFSRPQLPLRPAPATLGWSILVITLLITAWLARDMAALGDRRAAARQLPVAPALHAPVPATVAAEIRFADDSLRTAAIPWEALFSDIEVARPLEITFLSLQVQGRVGEIRFNGETPRFETLTAFLTMLDQRPTLSGSQLLSHQVDEARREVKFDARVRWKTP